MRVDAHQHFWEYTPEEYPWMDEPLSLLKRHFLPPDLLPELMKAGLDGTVAVQARQSLEESRWLLELSDQYPAILGVVGWVDLCTTNVDDQLERFQTHPKFVGVRHVVQDEPDDSFMLRPDFQRGIQALAQHHLTYDILIYPHQLPAALALVRKFPDQPFVVDHLAKPLIGKQVIKPWCDQMAELASYPHVECKLSGMVTEATWGQWQPDDFKPYLDAVFRHFGPDRLMYGTDWPVCLLSAEYQAVHALIMNHIASFTVEEQDAIMGTNAIRFYDLKVAAPSHPFQQA